MVFYGTPDHTGLITAYVFRDLEPAVLTVQAKTAVYLTCSTYARITMLQHFTGHKFPSKPA